MNKFEYSVICIDFRDFSSGEELDNFFDDCNISLDGHEWYGFYLGEWIQGFCVTKVWLDKNTLSLISYEIDGQQIMYPLFGQYLNVIEPINRNFQKVESTTNQTIQDLTVDGILDKILKFGKNSLSPTEKKFLDSQS